ncbi:MAG: cytidylate kinase family protein [Lactobacillales bacterium]|jgi:cytidylate kinase|nr:cytidylate kinase family protein [Lactobacillales bacterium]
MSHPSPKTILTISGQLGSGKSTVAKLLAQKLGYEYYSTGTAHRAIAEKRGISTLELNRQAMTDDSIDREVDSQYGTLDNSGKNYVVDSRLAYHFLPHSIKIKLNVDPDVAGNRIFNDTKRTQEQPYKTAAEATQGMLGRRALEVARWKKIYGTDIDDPKNFDDIIDTTNKTPEQTANLIIQKFHLK